MARRRRKKKTSILQGTLKFVGKIVAGLVLLSLCLVLLFRVVPVPLTPLMLIRGVEQLTAGEDMQIRHRWVSIETMSKHVVLAVICSEDQRFFNHHGFDLEAIKDSVSAAVSGNNRLRGASTISQQTAKNVFLWPQRSWLRKGFEVYFTILIELAWSKKRILEVYLNSIEMAEGVYGVEAASLHYFKIDAAKLNRRQAAAIAAVLPNPREYRAQPPSSYIRSRINWIVGQMHHWGELRLD